jgi:hypothetical protein
VGEEVVLLENRSLLLQQVKMMDLLEVLVVVLQINKVLE